MNRVMSDISTSPRHAQATAIASRLIEEIRRLSKAFPEEEDMGMVPDIRAAVMDLHKATLRAGNVDNREDFLAYTDDIRGKAARLGVYLDFARDLEYCDEDKHAAITRNIEEICDLIEPPAKPKLVVVE